MSRPLSSLVLSTLAVGVVAAATATTAAATAAPAAVSAVSAVSGAIVGDITADGRPDQVTLGSDRAVMPSCSARVLVRKSNGGLGTGSFRPLPVRGTVVACPDLGAVVGGPQPRLAVAWSSVAPMGAKSVQLFRYTAATHTWTYDGGFTGQVQPSSLVSTDLDGDDSGDLVETTDQGDGVSAFVGTSSTWRRLWGSAPSSSDTFSTANLDHGPGVDLVDGHGFFGAINVGVTVVDGRTGNTRVLVADTSGSGITYLPQAVDVDHDGWLDIRVRRVSPSGPALSTWTFHNNATGKLSFTRV